ncbi:MAG: sulfur carrier protein ThiS [Actinomycetota bacterium]
MLILLNGKQVDLPGRPSIPDVLAILGYDSPRGVALAVDGKVVPKGAWGEVQLSSGMRIEVLRAVQGG